MNFAAVLSFVRQCVPYYLGVNAFLLFGFAYNRFASYLVRDFLSVTGTVTRSGVFRHVRMGSHDSPSRSAPLIVYTYEVNGETYTNQRIAPGFGISGYAADMVKRFPVGSSVTVYYMPGSPAVSFLSKSSLIEPYLRTYFIIGNLLMPLIVLMVHFFKTSMF